MIEGEHATSQAENLAGLSQRKHGSFWETDELGALVKWDQLVFLPPL